MGFVLSGTESVFWREKTAANAVRLILFDVICPSSRIIFLIFFHEDDDQPVFPVPLPSQASCIRPGLCYLLFVPRIGFFGFVLFV